MKIKQAIQAWRRSFIMREEYIDNMSDLEVLEDIKTFAKQLGSFVATKEEAEKAIIVMTKN